MKLARVVAAAVVLSALGCKSEGEIAYDKAESARHACIAGDPKGCAEACEDNVMLDGPDQRREVCSAACESNVPSACQTLGRTYDSKDKQALPFFEKGCKLGNGPSCTDAGDLVSETTPASDQAGMRKALDFWGEACDKGSDRGCLRVGRIFIMLKKNDVAATALHKCWRKNDDGSFGVSVQTKCAHAYMCAAGEFFDGKKIDAAEQQAECGRAFSPDE